MAVLFCLCGCATSIETPVRKRQPCSAPQPLRVGVLPPRIHPSLGKENFKAEKPFYKQLIDGRGMVVTSGSPSKDIGLEIVSVLTRAGKYQRIFTIGNEDDAQRFGADALLTVTVRDYRTALLGSNKNYLLMTLLSPLMSQYWIRWLTLEARLDWEVKLTSVADGSILYRKRLKKQYTSPVRSAFGHHFTDKMLSFLENRAAPDFISELFELGDSSIEKIPTNEKNNEWEEKGRASFTFKK
ncbi:MAG: hypothetical protein MUC65_09790 [Pontiellaceae bacterium]|nr:hypothetical protein [Pontiellaceae bacterium]